MLFPGEPGGPALVGIARKAAQSESLEAKRRVEYFELPTQKYITRCSSPRMPFEWTINPYRGCEFGCKYCYARYTHEFMELRQPADFEQKIYAKEFRAEDFRLEWRRISRNEHIAIGTGTDPYQPAERRYGVTRSMLEIISGERGYSLSITTKSDAIARDVELLAAISRSNLLSVNMTVTTVDEELARLIEPMAPRPSLRLEAVSKLNQAGIQAGVFANPIMPLINDRQKSIDAVASAAARAGARYFGGNVLFLKPCSFRVFLPFLKERFPHLESRYRERYEKSAYLRGAYPETIRERIRTARERFGLGRGLVDYRPDLWEGDAQFELDFS
jgi:DNA repair photolyase